MPSLSAWPAHCAESCSITSLSSARTTFDASSPSTCVSTMRDARTKLSRTSSRFHVPRRRRAASTQSLCSPDSIMTTGASLDERHARRLPADEICSQHGRSTLLELSGMELHEVAHVRRCFAGELAHGVRHAIVTPLPSQLGHGREMPDEVLRKPRLPKTLAPRREWDAAISDGPAERLRDRRFVRYAVRGRRGSPLPHAPR